jgi:hypothetical protein
MLAISHSHWRYRRFLMKPACKSLARSMVEDGGDAWGAHALLRFGGKDGLKGKVVQGLA